MKLRCFELAWFGLLLVALGPGCGKSDPGREPANAATSPPPPRGETVARLHWLGKKRLAEETNATYFMSILKLPASAKLEAQTLDKLSVAPWRVANTNASPTNGPSAQLRPLLDDL